MLPWGSIYYAWRMNDLTRRLIFKNPSTRHALRSFLGEFALEFRVSFIQATPKGLLLFVPVLVMNTLGFIADALRLFNSI